MSLFDQLSDKNLPPVTIKHPIKKVTITPNGCGEATNTVKDVKGRIRAATILRAKIISSRTHLMGG